MSDDACAEASLASHLLRKYIRKGHRYGVHAVVSCPSLSEDGSFWGREGTDGGLGRLRTDAIRTCAAGLAGATMAARIEVPAAEATGPSGVTTTIQRALLPALTASETYILLKTVLGGRLDADTNSDVAAVASAVSALVDGAVEGPGKRMRDEQHEQEQLSVDVLADILQHIQLRDDIEEAPAAAALPAHAVLRAFAPLAVEERLQVGSSTPPSPEPEADDDTTATEPVTELPISRPAEACAAAASIEPNLPDRPTVSEPLAPTGPHATARTESEGLAFIRRVLDSHGSLPRNRESVADDDNFGRPTQAAVLTRNEVTTPVTRREPGPSVTPPSSRRRRVPYTPEEDLAIVQGLRRFAGQGRFTDIFNAYRDVWQAGRTPTALYDHWRSTIRSAALNAPLEL